MGWKVTEHLWRQSLTESEPGCPRAIALIWVASVMADVFSPVQRAWLNRSLDPSNRATLFSVDGQADALGQVVGGPIIGVVASGVSIRAALVCSAALLTLALPLLARALGQAPIGRLKPDLKSAT